VIIDDERHAGFYTHIYCGYTGVKIIAEFENAEQALAKFLNEVDIVIVIMFCRECPALNARNGCGNFQNKVLLVTGHECGYINSN